MLKRLFTTPFFGLQSIKTPLGYGPLLEFIWKIVEEKRINAVENLFDLEDLYDALEAYFLINRQAKSTLALLFSI